MRIQASIVQLPPNFRTEEEMQNWKGRSSAGWLENGILYYLQQNSAHPSLLGLEREEGLWEETGAEDSSETQTACWLRSLFDLTPNPGFLNEALWRSPCFLYFCDFHKQICSALPDFGVNTVFLQSLHLLPLSSAEVWEVPSAGLVRSFNKYFLIGWNSWPQRACVD